MPFVHWPNNSLLSNKVIQSAHYWLSLTVFTLSLSLSLSLSSLFPLFPLYISLSSAGIAWLLCTPPPPPPRPPPPPPRLLLLLLLLLFHPLSLLVLQLLLLLHWQILYV